SAALAPRGGGSDAREVSVEQLLEFGGVLPVDTKTLADLAGHGAVGRSVRLEQQVVPAADLDSAKTALGRLRTPDTVLRHLVEARHDRHRKDTTRTSSGVPPAGIEPATRGLGRRV